MYTYGDVQMQDHNVWDGLKMEQLMQSNYCLLYQKNITNDKNNTSVDEQVRSHD